MKSYFFPRSVTFLLVLSFVLNSCSWQSSSSRKPASLNQIEGTPKGEDFENFSVEIPTKKIYKYKGLLKAPPLRHLVEKVAEVGLLIFLKKLPLKEDVHERLKQNIKSDHFAGSFVPFLMAMKDLYLAAGKNKKRNFYHHVLTHFEKDEFPGMTHSMFSFDKKKKAKVKEEDQKPEDGEADNSTKVMIAAGIEIFDAIVTSDPNFSLSKPPVRTNALVEKVSPLMKGILDVVKSGMDPKDPAYETVVSIADVPDRLKAATASLIDVVHYYAYKHHNMFANRFIEKEKLKAWLKNKFENDQDALDRYLKSLGEKKYGVHVIVDGLPGHLLESMAKGKSSAPYLQHINNEFKNRESFRPKKIAHKDLDEVNTKWFEWFMDQDYLVDHSHYLPFFKKLYARHENSIARQGVSSTPTISVRNVPIIQVGAPVAGTGGTGLPNFHFVDRQDDRAYYFWGNDAFLLEPLTKKQGMKTLPDRLPHLNNLACMLSYESGAKWSIDALFNIVLGEKNRDFGDILCMSELERRIPNDKKLASLIEDFYKESGRERKKESKQKKKLLDILEKIGDIENETLPEYVNYYNPWPDHFAHFKGPFGDEILSPTGELNRFDYWMGRLTDIYVRAGIYDKTLFVMAGDHGLAPVKYVLQPEAVVWGELKKEGYDIKVNKISSDEGEGPKLNDHLKPATMHGYDVIVASTAGGNHMLDFFLDQNENFKTQPTYQDLIDYKLLSGQRLNVMNELVTRLDDTLDYLVVRESKCSIKKCAVRVIGKRGGIEKSAKIFRVDEKIFYESEGDLLEVLKLGPYSTEEKGYSKTLGNVHQKLVAKCIGSANFLDPKTWCDENEWRNLSSFTNRPDSVAQLSRIYDTDLAGTINLFPATYIGYNSKVPGRHAGELFMEKDSFVGVWGAPVKNNKRIHSEINGSIVPTIYEYLTGKKIVVGEEGWGYRSLMNQLGE